MKKYLSLIIVSIITLLASGCKSTHMKPATEQMLTNAPADKAQIVFMRVSMLGGAIQASLFDTTSGKPEFIGISSTDTKVSYFVEPGEHTFMVVSEAADFMQANVEAGKTYYAVVTPRMGFWKARFSLRPIHKDEAYEKEFSMTNKKFTKWLNDTLLVENSDSALVWAKNNNDDIQEKYQEYWPVWQEKPTDEKEALTLRVIDHG